MKKDTFIRAIAIVLVLTLLFNVTGCSKKEPDYIEAHIADSIESSGVIEDPNSSDIEDTIDPEAPSDTGDSSDDSNSPDIDNTQTDIVDPGEWHTIEYRSMFAGFTSVSVEDREEYESFCQICETYKIILSDDDWHSFMNDFCPGLRYDDAPDYRYECLIVDMLHPALPTRTGNSPVLSVSVNNYYISVEHDEDYASRYYVLNRYPTCHFAFNLLIIGKDDLPKNLPEEFIYKAK